MGSRTLGKWSPKKIDVPSQQMMVRLVPHTNLMITKTTKDYYYFFGYGKVNKIYKNNAFDIVFVDFGNGNGNKIYLVWEDARKQLSTLKVGQYAMFGLIKNRHYKDNGPVHYMAIWVMGIYVPKIVDIRNKELTEEEIEEMTTDEYNEGFNFLDNFKKND